jgi:hypothetical protein
VVEKQYCAQVSQETGEPFFGTAPRVDTWLLLEYTGTWGVNAIEESTLPATVKNWIANAHSRYPFFRTQFIRQHIRPNKAITCFIAITREDRQAIYHFQFESYTDLLALDLPALITGNSFYNTYLFERPLFLVCTHGKHDLCCAKFGIPIYSELLKQAGALAWQTSHLGGDKFAANLLCLPTSLYYGHVTVSEVKTIIDMYTDNQVYLAKYRGQTCYNAAVQAADYFLRKKRAQPTIGAFKLVSFQCEATETCTVQFEDLEEGNVHRLLISHETKEVYRRLSCHGKGKNTIHSYRLGAHDILVPAIAERI